MTQKQFRQYCKKNTIEGTHIIRKWKSEYKGKLYLNENEWNPTNITLTKSWKRTENEQKKERKRTEKKRRKKPNWGSTLHDTCVTSNVYKVKLNVLLLIHQRR